MGYAFVDVSPRIKKVGNDRVELILKFNKELKFL